MKEKTEFKTMTVGVQFLTSSCSVNCKLEMFTVFYDNRSRQFQSLFFSKSIKKAGSMAVISNYDSLQQNIE